MRMLSSVTSVIGLVILLLAILAYYFLENTILSFELKKFIAFAPNVVFEYLKDPVYLVDIHHKIRDVAVVNLRVDEMDVEHRQYTIYEDLPHIGTHKNMASSIADPIQLTIRIHMLILHGLIHGDVAYYLTESWNGTVAGTTIEEVSTFQFPWILAKFLNRTTTETHAQLLDNLETLIELRTKS